MGVVAALSVAVSAWAVAPAAAQGASGAFSDDDGAYYEAPFDALAERGILAGTECAQGQICPDDPIKRSTMAVWLGRALTGSEPTDTGASRFADVDAGHWTAPHIERFAELDVTRGCATDPLRYCPDDNVTRDQMAAFLVRAFDLDEAPSAGFTDTAGHYFETEIDKLAEARITLGCASQPRRYCPNQDVTRGQMATFIARALGLIPTPEPQPATAPAIAISDTHGCKLSADGQVACWGDDTHGQASPPPGTYTDIAVNTNYSCAIRSDGQLACWGDNTDGRTTPPAGGFTAVTSNPTHPCGVRADGAIVCWGDSDTSYPGGGSTDRPPSGTFTDISLSDQVGCGVRTDQSIQCWGWTADRLGIGPSPQGNFTTVAVAHRRACALRTDGTITCWGNAVEALHDAPAGSHTDVSVAGSSVGGYSCALRTDLTITCWGEDTVTLPHRAGEQPTTIVGLTSPPTGQYQALALTDHHACALRSDNTHTCWGGPAPGDSDTVDDDSTGSFMAVAAGGSHSCGLRTDGTITCWGWNVAGQVDAPPGHFTAVAAGGDHSCGLRTDGTITCWGSSGLGQVDAPPGNFTAVAAGWRHSCGLRSDGTITCWGSNYDGEADAPAGNFTAVAAGGDHSCGLRSDGTITCWGSNRWGALDVPMGNFTAVVANSRDSCGLRSDGTIVCWGDNLGEEMDAPAGNFTAVAAGDRHGCGLRTDGTITCWGSSGLGQVDAPAGNFTAVAALGDHSCGLRSDGTIVCWGDNRWGQVDAGDGQDDLDDCCPRIVVSPTDLAIPEGSTSSYSIVLAAQPARDVEVYVGSDIHSTVRVDPSVLTFTTSNWRTPQRITVRANHDQDGDSTDRTTVVQNSTNYLGSGVGVRITISDSPSGHLRCTRSEATREPPGQPEDVRIESEDSGIRVHWRMPSEGTCARHIVFDLNPFYLEFPNIGALTDSATYLEFVKRLTMAGIVDEQEVNHDGSGGYSYLVFQHQLRGGLRDVHEVRVIASNESGFSVSDPAVVPEERFAARRSEFRDLRMAIESLVSAHGSNVSWLGEVWSYVLNLERDPHPTGGRFMPFVFMTNRDTVEIAGVLPAGNAWLRPYCSGVQPNSCDVVGEGISAKSNQAGLIAHELGHIYTLSTGASSNPVAIEAGFLYLERKWRSDPSYNNPDTSNPFWSATCNSAELFADVASYLVLLAAGRPPAQLGYWVGCTDHDLPPDGALSVLTEALGGYVPATEEQPDPYRTSSVLFDAVSAGDAHSCGLKTDGTITCWGNNSAEQASAPSGAFSAVSAGGVHSCGLRTDNTITCWGGNNEGQADAPSGAFSAVSAGDRRSCGLRTGNTITCWGLNPWGQTPSGAFSAVSAGNVHSCGLRTDNTITCWGLNVEGSANAPSRAFSAVSVSDVHSCGLTTDDTITCWGNNRRGQTSAPSGAFSAVSAGDGHSCGLTTDGAITCWGWNHEGQASAPSGAFSAVSAGAGHSCGLRIDSTITCWGRNDEGQADPP